VRNSLADDHPVTLATFVDARMTAATVLLPGPARPGHEFRRVDGRQVETIGVRQEEIGRRRRVQQLSHLVGRHVDQHFGAVAFRRVVIVADRHGRVREPVQQQQLPERVPIVRHRRTAKPRRLVVRPVRRTTFPDRRRGDVTVARTAADRFDRSIRTVSVPAGLATAARITATVYDGGGDDGTMADDEPQQKGETRSDGPHRVRTLLRFGGSRVRRRIRSPATAAAAAAYHLSPPTTPRDVFNSRRTDRPQCVAAASSSQ